MEVRLLATTKLLGQKDALDRFYTKPEIAAQLIEKVGNLSNYDFILEPAAGNGAFSKQINGCFAIDIAPADETIKQMNFFEFYPPDKYNILVIGSPPFGQQNKMALEFFNYAARWAATIAFVLPMSFRKKSVQDKMDLNFHLIDELVLPSKSFTLNGYEKDMPCVFQIWQRISIPRKIVELPITSSLFAFVKKEEADFRIQRVGGNAGKATKDLEKATSSNYFIKNLSEKTDEEFINYVNTLTFPEMEYTTGPKSLSKGELVSIIEKFWS